MTPADMAILGMGVGGPAETGPASGEHAGTWLDHEMPGSFALNSKQLDIVLTKIEKAGMWRDI